MNKKQKAFTLIELIVVVAIIAILAVVVVVRVNGYIAKAKNAKRNSDMENYVKAFSLYYTDHGDYPTFEGDDYCCCLGNLGDEDTCQWSQRTCDKCYFVNGDIQQYLPGLPFDKQFFTFNGSSAGGYALYFDHDGGGPTYTMIWYLYGENQNCGAGYEMYSSDGVTECQYRFVGQD